MVSVALGWRQATRRGGKFEVIREVDYKNEEDIWCSLRDALLCQVGMYSSQLLDHFEHPRNAGDLPNANTRVRVENPACGDILELAASVENGRIQTVRFRAKGCVSAMACGSAITELAAGKTFAEGASLNSDDVVRAVGGLPPASGHAAQLAIDALKALLRETSTND